MEQLLAFINSLPKEQQERFAEACCTSIGYLRKACSKKQLLSPALCVLIETHSGKIVTRQILRQHDWEENWPELAEAA